MSLPQGRERGKIKNINGLFAQKKKRKKNPKRDLPPWMGDQNAMLPAEKKRSERLCRRDHVN